MYQSGHSGVKIDRLIKLQYGLRRSHLQAIDLRKLKLLRRNCLGNLELTSYISNFSFQKSPSINPCRNKSVLGNLDIYLYFWPFLNIKIGM